ncbi:MAG: EAL domain-containing protein [[Eubacterium] rectale]|nr:EAL domain-containing protein [Agathobacter rectalis]
MTTLDYYVYEKAFAWLKERSDQGLPVVPIFLNVSPAHFNNIASFEQKVHELFVKYNPDPRLLIFEITEEVADFLTVA